ncbi:hypothetical protein K2173_005666 [Erythroxylum novogranatense]|uniref:Uncharacterized protein n=1 Tax=Erythroxylum novogranatense TaxID=1862640 RepID=A0AAV8SR48_9ROSI|nr:hypothetical protein K2173_005666 [Erythroxylum novogranatense]
MAAQLLFRAFFRATHQELPSIDRLTDDPGTQKSLQSTVTSVYQTPIGGLWHNVTISSCRNLMNHCVNLMIKSLEGEIYYSCKVDIHWDFHSAKFSSTPEQFSDYYVGDHKKKAYRRTKGRPAFVKGILYYKKETVFAKKSLSTRAKLDKNN